MLFPLFFCLFFLALAGYLRWRVAQTYPVNTVGFLHADSGNGGGGERVLWVAIDQIQRADEAANIDRQYVLYTKPYPRADGTRNVSEHGLKTFTCNSDAKKRRLDDDLLTLVESQFHIHLRRKLNIVYLSPSATRWLRADQYPRLTLLLQTVVGGVALFYACAVARISAPIMVETVGVPMVYPLLTLLCGARVVSYTHFPIVSSSMVERVRSGTTSTTNKGAVVSNPALRLGKLVYYQLFTVFYRVLGQFPSIVFTNSSWTQGHISALFWPRKTTLLYPPCDVTDFAEKSRSPKERTNTIVSVGQFRPEKNHMLQLHAFHRATREGLPSDARLVMLGGARDNADRARANAIVAEAAHLGIADRVDVLVNAPFQAIVDHLTQGCVGLHTMLDEHFGIVVLEYLAAGIVPLAHNSGGVRLDIVARPELGFLATTEEEFAAAMVRICHMRQHDPAAYRGFQERGTDHVQSFSDDAFGEQLYRHLAPLF